MLPDYCKKTVRGDSFIIFDGVTDEGVRLIFCCCQKRIQKKFKSRYETDKGFARACRLVVFLAFVPVEQ